MIRHAWRTLARMPIVSGVIVFSLAAGIGVNTVVFSWIQARMLKPMPAVDEGARFYGIEAKTDAGLYPASSWLEYEDLRAGLRSFDAVIASRMIPLYVGDPGEVQRAYGVLSSGNCFDALGVRPAAGRFFRADEVAARAPVAVISYGIWQSRFGGRADISGQRLRMNGTDMSVLGVTPRDFHGTVLGLSFDVWVPATLAPVVLRGSSELDERGFRGYSLLGKLKRGVTLDQAQSEAGTLMAQLAAAYPATNAALGVEVLAIHNSPRGPNRLLNAALIVLQIIMLLVLLAVCGNTANLVLARASARQREVGVRLALGSGPRRIAALLLTENIILGMLGAAGGAVIAMWGTEALKVLPMTGLPIRMETSLDVTGLSFAAVLGLACGLIVGAIPAAHLARLDPMTAFRAGALTAGRSRARSLLMASQVSLAIVVLIAGALFIRSFVATRTEETGFRRDGVLLAAYDLSGRNMNGAAMRAFTDRLLERVRALPGVEQAAISSSMPLDIHGLPMRIFTLEGRTRAEEGEDQALTNTVSPGYFTALGIGIEEGRDFAPLTDVTAPQQAVVNRAFVDQFVGDGSVIGRRLTARGGSYVITGVVATSLYNAFGEPPTPIIYFSYRDRPSTAGEIHAVARSGGDPTALAPAIRSVVRELDADLPVFNVRTMHQHVDTNLVFRRVPARMFAFLGPLLLVLAAIGIYAVVAYSMSLRTTEIGVRLALGASAPRVVRDFVAETMRIIIAGAAVGWLAAFVIALNAMDAPLEVSVFAGVPALLIAVGMFACWLPAHRASKLEPWRALR